MGLRLAWNTLNPFRCRVHGVPSTVVLWVKIVAVVLLESWLGGPAPVAGFVVLGVAMAFSTIVLFSGSWPQGAVTVIWDGSCGFCASAKKTVCFFDVDGILVWYPFQSGAGRELGISDDQATEKMYVAHDGRTWSGFAAFKKIALWNPVWHLAGWSILAIPAIGPLPKAAILAAVLLFFSPLFSPVGEAAYAWVARNRHRLGGNSACGIGTTPG